MNKLIAPSAVLLAIALALPSGALGVTTASQPSPHGNTPAPKPAPAASSALHDGITLSELQAFLQKQGFSVTRTAPQEGSVFLEVNAGQIPFDATTIGCGNTGSCAGMVLITLDVKSHPTLQEVNQDNSSGGYTRYALDKSGDVALILPHIVYGGVTDTNLKAVVFAFLNTMVQYAKSHSGEVSLLGSIPETGFAGAAGTAQYISALSESLSQGEGSPFAAPQGDEAAAILDAFK